MKALNLLTKSILFFLLTQLFSVCATAQESPLQLKVVTSSEGSLYANFTLIMGETDILNKLLCKNKYLF